MSSAYEKLYSKKKEQMTNKDETFLSNSQQDKSKEKQKTEEQPEIEVEKKYFSEKQEKKKLVYKKDFDDVKKELSDVSSQILQKMEKLSNDYETFKKENKNDEVNTNMYLLNDSVKNLHEKINKYDDMILKLKNQVTNIEDLL